MDSVSIILEEDERAIKSLARWLASGDYDVACDLEQAGREVLYRLPRQKCARPSSKSRYSAVKNAMLNLLRREYRRKRIEKEAAVAIYFGRFIAPRK